MNDDQIKKHEDIVREYEKDLNFLMRYLPYLEKKGAADEQTFYRGENANFKSVPFPVYDSTLLSFVKDAGNTKFMTKNYQYVYRRHRINGVEDEKRLLSTAKIGDMDIFCGILSRYVMEGRRRGVVWTEGLQYQIYLDVLRNLNKVFYKYYEPEKLIH